MSDELTVNPAATEDAFEKEEKASGLIGGMKNKVDSLAHSVADAAKQGIGEASKVRDLKKFLDLELEVFSSTAEADRKVEEENERARSKCLGLLHPETTVSVVYNQMHVCFLLYMLAILPVRTAFGINPSPGSNEFIVDVVIDILIFIDIILNFSKYHKDGAELVTDSARLKREYLRGWFIVDLLSVLPFNYIMLFVSSDSDSSNIARSARFFRFVRAARFLRLIKLAKLSKLRDAMRVLKEFLNCLGVSALEVEFGLRMIGLVVLMLGVGHVTACLWLYVGRSGLQRETPEGWMVGSHEIARIALPDGTIGLKEGEYIHEQYVDAFYWSIVTMSSVGYGDVLPTTTSERELGVIVITIGAFLYAYIIGAFSTIMAALSYDSARYDTKMRTVANYLKFLKVDPNILNRINRFYEFRFANKIMFSEDDIIKDLPPKLKAEIVLHRFQPTVDRIPFFRGLSEDVITSICVQFREYAVLPGDFVVCRGDPYRELLVLTKGKCRSVPPEEDDLETVSPRSYAASAKHSGGGSPIAPVPTSAGVVEYPAGSFFGELEFLGVSDTRPTSIRAKSYCELSSLHPADIAGVVSRCTTLRSRLEKYANLKQILAEEQCDEFDVERRKQEAEEEFENEVDNIGAAQAVDMVGDTNVKIMHMLTELTASNAAVVERLKAVEAAVGVG